MISKTKAKSWACQLLHFPPLIHFYFLCACSLAKTCSFHVCSILLFSPSPSPSYSSGSRYACRRLWSLASENIQVALIEKWTLSVYPLTFRVYSQTSWGNVVHLFLPLSSAPQPSAQLCFLLLLHPKDVIKVTVAFLWLPLELRINHLSLSFPLHALLRDVCLSGFSFWAYWFLFVFYF